MPAGQRAAILARKKTRAIGKLGAKFVAGEHPASKTNPFFRQKDRPANQQADQYANGEHHWRKQNKRDPRNAEVEGSLEDSTERAAP